MSRILIADDEPHIRKLVSFTLGNRGYEVVEASDGGEAVRLARETRPDLILLDVMMPELDGFEVCRRLRSTPAFATLPVVVISARTESEAIERAMQAGANIYLTKPLRLPDLLNEIEKLLP